MIKAELRRKNLENTMREELRIQLTLLETFISELKGQLKECKDNLKKCQVTLAESKKNLANRREERGKPEASISAEIELLLEKYYASRAAYHGGDYNGISCRRIVGNSTEIAKGIRMVLEAKRNESCEQDTIIKKINELEHMLGLLDTAFWYLNISHPTDEEK